MVVVKGRFKAQVWVSSKSVTTVLGNTLRGHLAEAGKQQAQGPPGHKPVARGGSLRGQQQGDCAGGAQTACR